VFKGGEHPRQTGVEALGPVDAGWVVAAGGCQLAQVQTLGVLKTECSGKRVDDLVGDMGLASLLDASQVVGADASQMRELLSS
jgi:hypothetical protein